MLNTDTHELYSTAAYSITTRALGAGQSAWLDRRRAQEPRVFPLAHQPTWERTAVCVSLP